MPKKCFHQRIVRSLSIYRMMRWGLVVALVVVVVGSLGRFSSSFALDEVEELQRQIGELENLKKLSEDATTPLEKEVSTLESRIASAQAGITKAQADVKALAASIAKREGDLAQQYQILARRVGDEYKRARQASSPAIALAQLGQGSLSRSIAYHQSVQQQDKAYITSISGDIIALEKDKKDLEQRQKTLASLQDQLDQQAEFFKGEIAKAKDYRPNCVVKLLLCQPDSSRFCRKDLVLLPLLSVRFPWRTTLTPLSVLKLKLPATLLPSLVLAATPIAMV